ncbi:MAG TPA: TlpA disulfide reductase family protein [Micromonosporaceae bacterium]
MSEGTRRAFLAAAAAAVAVTLAGVAGCTGGSAGRTEDGSTVSSPFQPCPPVASAAPAGSPAGAGPPQPAAGPPLAAASTGEPLPDLTLPCFTGGEPVALARLGRPAILNLWASWCQPCRKELPEFQRLAGASAGRLVVLGVVTGDTRSSAASAAQDLDVSFPSVFDARESLRLGLARTALPVTAFVGADGRVRHVDITGALTFARLTELTRQYLGVEVS